MQRRAFITLLGGAAAAVCPLAVHSQQSSRMRHIGVLMSLEENDPEGKVQLSGFTQGLSDLGWTNGSNLRIEVRWGGGDVNQIRAFAKELVAAQPDLILSQGTPVTAALQRETRTIPIVFVVVTDPVGEGFVEGLPRPGGNITGFITSEAAICSKMLDLILEIAPDITRAAMLFNPDTAPGRGNYYLGDFETAARSSKVEPIAGFFHAKSPPANLAANSTKQCTYDLSLEVRRDYGRRSDFVWTRLKRYSSSRRPLRRSHSSRCEACRLAGSSAGEIRDGAERQNSRGAWPYSASVASIAGRRSDRIEKRDFWVWPIATNLAGLAKASLRRQSRLDLLAASITARDPKLTFVGLFSTDGLP